ncbi:MAG: hypothetical protein KDD40_05360 [Bdellovibrionales bacterium]|nr:hypothetical protein [Bdellovibrionales bacterium]
MNLMTIVLIILVPIVSHSRLDVVDWNSLEENWRTPLCLQEAVYPLTADRAKEQLTKKEQELKAKYEVKNLESLAYAKVPPTPDILPALKELIVLQALAVERSENRSKSYIQTVKKYAKSVYAICSRILNQYPSTRCHDFLLINIKPNDFLNLVGSHFSQYRSSAIYQLDMQAQCREANNPDWNCSELAMDYFAKNHLQSCIAGHLEPPEKLEPLAELSEETNSN